MKSVLISITLFTATFIALASEAYAERLPYYDSLEFTPHWIEESSPELQGFHQVSDFALTNQNNKIITEKTVENKIYIASFFFSTCPGICPSVRSKLKEVQEAYKNDDTVLILSHSINPEVDTPQVLKKYAIENGIVEGKWHLLTGERDEIYDLAKTQYFANEDLGEYQKSEDFLHSENLLLIDTHRRIRGIYNGLSASSVKDLVSDIRLLKKEG